MKVITQKRISEFSNTKPKKQGKIIKYCLSIVTNVTENTESEVICLTGPKESKKQVKKPVGQPKREKETKEIIEVLYNSHDLHQMVKYEKLYEGCYVEDFHSNCSIVNQGRYFLCARNWKFVSTMQHIKTVEKLQEFLVFKIQLLGKYV